VRNHDARNRAEQLIEQRRMTHGAGDELRQVLEAGKADRRLDVREASTIVRR